MLLIQGPFPQNTSALVLPSPQETNTESLTSTVKTIRMDDGSLRTYVRRNSGRKKFRWDFLVGHNKAREIEEYFISNSGEKALATWKGTVYLGYLTLNPLELSGQVGETYRVTIEFQEA